MPRRRSTASRPHRPHPARLWKPAAERRSRGARRHRGLSRSLARFDRAPAHAAGSRRHRASQQSGDASCRGRRREPRPTLYGSSEGRLYPTISAGIGCDATARRRRHRAVRRRSARRSGRRSISRTRCSTSVAAPDRSTSRVRRRSPPISRTTRRSRTRSCRSKRRRSTISRRARSATREGHRSIEPPTRSTRRTSGTAWVSRRSPTCCRRGPRGRRPSFSSQTLEGSLQVTRGGLAVAMGLPANTSFDVPDVPATDSVHFVAESVDSLIEVAVRNRPELATARAQAAAAQSADQGRAVGGTAVADVERAPAPNSSNVSGFCGTNLLAQLRRTGSGVHRILESVRRQRGQRAVPGRARARRGHQAAGHSAGVHGVLHASHGDRSRPHVAPICWRAPLNPRRSRASGIRKASAASWTCSSRRARWPMRGRRRSMRAGSGARRSRSSRTTSAFSNARGDTSFAPLTPAPEREAETMNG